MTSVEAMSDIKTQVLLKFNRPIKIFLGGSGCPGQGTGIASQFARWYIRLVLNSYRLVTIDSGSNKHGKTDHTETNKGADTRGVGYDTHRNAIKQRHREKASTNNEAA